jgi:hypothetical protein
MIQLSVKAAAALAVRAYSTDCWFVEEEQVFFQLSGFVVVLEQQLAVLAGPTDRSNYFSVQLGSEQAHTGSFRSRC